MLVHVVFRASSIYVGQGPGCVEAGHHCAIIRSSGSVPARHRRSSRYGVIVSFDDYDFLESGGFVKAGAFLIW